MGRSANNNTVYLSVALAASRCYMVVAWRGERYLPLQIFLLPETLKHIIKKQFGCSRMHVTCGGVWISARNNNNYLQIDLGFAI